jgi:hypothetical protein
MTQKLILAEDVFDELDGNKRCTIRKGCRDIQLGELNFESEIEKRIMNVNVYMIMYCKLEDIPAELVENDGFTDYEDMLIKMKRFYPDIEMTTECTSILF